MAAAVRSGQGRRRGRRARRGSALLAEINVTPFVDVMLVLLVIFMVSAPLLSTVIPIELPKSASTATSLDDRPLSIEIDEKGQTYLLSEPLDLEALEARLLEIAKNGTDQKIYVLGDRAVSFGRIGEVLGLLIKAGFTNVTFPTLPTGG